MTMVMMIFDLRMLRDRDIVDVADVNVPEEVEGSVLGHLQPLGQDLLLRVVLLLGEVAVDELELQDVHDNRLEQGIGQALVVVGLQLLE